MENYTRWYDKDRNLNAFMAFLQTLDKAAQAEIASEILMNIPNVVGDDYDRFVNIISSHKPIGYKRWYDATLDLHTAVEVLKELNEKQVEVLMHSISDVLIKNSNPVTGEE